MREANVSISQFTESDMNVLDTVLFANGWYPYCWLWTGVWHSSITRGKRVKLLPIQEISNWRDDWNVSLLSTLNLFLNAVSICKFRKLTRQRCLWKTNGTEHTMILKTFMIFWNLSRHIFDDSVWHTSQKIVTCKSTTGQRISDMYPIYWSWFPKTGKINTKWNTISRI